MEEKREWLSPRLALQLAAPHTWPASVLPALFGIGYSFYCGEKISPELGFLLFGICVLMQSGVNTVNDFFDFVKGTDGLEDCLEEEDAVLLHHSLRPKDVLLLGLVFLGVAALLGLRVIWLRGLAPLVVGLIGGIAVLLYSGGPLPLSSLPVGELVSGVVMGGLIPFGIMTAAAGHFCPQILLPSLPFVFGIALIMFSNNGCDIEKDKRAGRHTLPVLLGRERTKAIYRGLTVSWLILICFLPLYLYGMLGFAGTVILLLFGRRCFRELLQLPLTQKVRILQMKTILKANVIGNGTYLLVLLLALF